MRQSWSGQAGVVLSLALTVCLGIAVPALASAVGHEAEIEPGMAVAQSEQHGEEPEGGARQQHAEEPDAAQHEEPDAAQHEQEGEHAQEGEHGEEGAHAAEGMPWSEVLFRWINFGLLAALMYWVLVVPPPFIQDIFSFAGLKAIFVQRSEAIVEAKALAEKQSSEADRILEQSETRLTRIEGEVAALIDQAHSDAEQEKDRAEEAGQAQADKIRDLSHRELRAETVAVQRKLKGFVAELAVGMAEKLLRENLTPEDQRRLVEDYVSRLGRSMN